MKGSEVKAIRLKLGMSQSEIADRLGYTQGATIHCWEHEKLPVPRMAAALLVAMSQGFDVRVDRYPRRGPLPSQWQSEAAE